jgi:hypothetical protein
MCTLLYFYDAMGQVFNPHLGNSEDLHVASLYLYLNDTGGLEAFWEPQPGRERLGELALTAEQEGLLRGNAAALNMAVTILGQRAKGDTAGKGKVTKNLVFNSLLPAIEALGTRMRESLGSTEFTIRREGDQT